MNDCINKKKKNLFSVHSAKKSFVCDVKVRKNVQYNLLCGKKACFSSYPQIVCHFFVSLPVRNGKVHQVSVKSQQTTRKDVQSDWHSSHVAVMLWIEIKLWPWSRVVPCFTATLVSLWAAVAWNNLLLAGKEEKSKIWKRNVNFHRITCHVFWRRILSILITVKPSVCPHYDSRDPRLTFKSPVATKSTRTHTHTRGKIIPFLFSSRGYTLTYTLQARHLHTGTLHCAQEATKHYTHKYTTHTTPALPSPFPRSPSHSPCQLIVLLLC